MSISTVLRFAALTVVAVAVANADEVTDWNQIMVDATFVPPIVAAPILTRSAAILQAAVFDAVNGIERRYTPIHVQPAAPPGASQRAAAVQAAYATLVKLFPAQQSAFGAKRDQSQAGIASGATAENGVSIARPITAIRLADTDGNPATTADLSWTPLIVTAPFPEYPSAHSCVSGTAGRVLSNYFGEDTSIQFTSEAMPGVTRAFSSFGHALDEIKNARRCFSRTKGFVYCSTHLSMREPYRFAI